MWCRAANEGAWPYIYGSEFRAPFVMVPPCVEGTVTTMTTMTTVTITIPITLDVTLTLTSASTSTSARYYSFININS